MQFEDHLYCIVHLFARTTPMLRRIFLIIYTFEKQIALAWRLPPWAANSALGKRKTAALIVQSRRVIIWACQ